MRCRRCNNMIPDGELVCPVCRTEVQIVPDYNPLDDVLEDQVRGGITQALNTGAYDPVQRQREAQNAGRAGAHRQTTGRTSGQRQNTGRAGVSREHSRINQDRITQEERMKRRRQAERKRMLAKKKRQRFLILSIVSIILVIIAGVFIYQNSYPGQVKKGYSLLEEMNYNESIVHFQKAIDKNGEKADAYTGLSKVYIAQKDLEKAEQVFLSAIQEHPENVVIYEAAIQFLLDTNQDSKIAYLLDDCKSEAVVNSLEQYATDVPVFALDETKVYDDIQALEITSNGKAIFYTTDGSDPTVSSSKYTEPIKLEEGDTIVKAISINEKDIPSMIVSKTYTIEFPIAAAPSVTPSTGQYDTQQTISVVVPDNYEAYYTTDGSDPVPGESGTKKYSKAVKMPSGNTIFKVVLVDQKGRLSDITIRNYDLTIEE